MITAERLDSWRIVPRALILSYMVVFYQTCNWFMSLPDPNNAQAGFVSVVVGAPPIIKPAVDVPLLPL